MSNSNMLEALPMLSDEQAETSSTMSQEVISETTVNCQQAVQWSQVLATCHAKLVIHAVGPRFNEAAIDHTFEEILMRNTITAILELVVKNDYKSVSIPAISTGVFKFPLTRFAVQCTKAIKEFINSHEEQMKNRKIILCNFDDDTTKRLLEVVPKVLESKEETDSKKKSAKKQSKNNSDEEESEKSEESEDEVKRCKECNKEIKSKSHQKKGKNKKICKKCFEKKKLKGKNNYC